MYPVVPMIYCGPWWSLVRGESGHNASELPLAKAAGVLWLCYIVQLRFGGFEYRLLKVIESNLQLSVARQEERRKFRKYKKFFG